MKLVYETQSIKLSFVLISENDTSASAVLDCVLRLTVMSSNTTDGTGKMVTVQVFDYLISVCNNATNYHEWRIRVGHRLNSIFNKFRVHE